MKKTRYHYGEKNSSILCMINKINVLEQLYIYILLKLERKKIFKLEHFINQQIYYLLVYHFLFYILVYFNLNKFKFQENANEIIKKKDRKYFFFRDFCLVDILIKVSATYFVLFLYLFLFPFFQEGKVSKKGITWTYKR